MPIRALGRWALKAVEWLQGELDWYCSPAWDLFDYPSSTTKLGDHHLKTVAFAMCEKRYGKEWMLKARVFHISIDAKEERARPFDFVRLEEQIRTISNVRPEIGICFLETPAHTMMLIHNNKDLCMAFDDMTGNFYLKELANQANRWLTQELDFAKVQIQYPCLSEQIDDHSCGFHVLHYLEHFMFEGVDATYTPPIPNNNTMDWRSFASHMNELVSEMFHVPYEIEKVHPPVSLQ